ncbi:hypothetical protein GCM10011378_40180 [Hymenobacter glacieicola]|uniref:Uncharacterized protein n=1 Tax=Hymenobacter glacieicola TaxID=1562124 RepID=A0ABQ1X6Q7_9BACT|nr:hypothetical protein GCM10011378_40180 [Hymenobacter glacieicola]
MSRLKTFCWPKGWQLAFVARGLIRLHVGYEYPATLLQHALGLLMGVGLILVVAVFSRRPYPSLVAEIGRALRSFAKGKWATAAPAEVLHIPGLPRIGYVNNLL